VTAKRQEFIALKWLMESADEKDDRVRIWDSLSGELLSAYNNEVQSYANSVFLLAWFLRQICISCFDRIVSV